MLCTQSDKTQSFKIETQSDQLTQQQFSPYKLTAVKFICKNIARGARLRGKSSVLKAMSLMDSKWRPIG